VADVQAFINRSQPIRYRLVVQRLSVDVIGPETAPNPPAAIPPEPPPAPAPEPPPASP
jgi:hypothetical protein